MLSARIGNAGGSADPVPVSVVTVSHLGLSRLAVVVGAAVAAGAVLAVGGGGRGGDRGGGLGSAAAPEDARQQQGPSPRGATRVQSAGGG